MSCSRGSPETAAGILARKIKVLKLIADSVDFRLFFNVR